MAKNGRYECAGQAPIVVTDGGDLPDGMHGPWVHYRFDWDTDEQVWRGLPRSDEQATPVLWTAFQSLLDSGYHHVTTPDGSAGR